MINDQILADALAERNNEEQRFLTLSFVGGQLYRSFEESSEGVFLPVLALFGEKYEAFQDNRIARAVDFKAVRPYFEYAEISNSGSSIQEKNQQRQLKQLLTF